MCFDKHAVQEHVLFLSTILAIVVEVTHQGQQVKYDGDVTLLCRDCQATVSNCWTEKWTGMVEWTILWNF